jgi:hypothetical protein
MLGRAVHRRVVGGRGPRLLAAPEGNRLQQTPLIFYMLEMLLD